MVKKHSWKFQQLDVAAVLATSPTVSAAARKLGVNRSSIQRWRRAGKLPAVTPSGRPPRPAATPRTLDQHPPSAEGWAASIRAAYDLTATELELLALAERARTLALDATARPDIQLAAAGRFQTLIRQLNLESPDNGQTEAAAPSRPRAAWPRPVVG